MLDVFGGWIRFGAAAWAHNCTNSGVGLQGVDSVSGLTTFIILGPWQLE